MPSIVRYNPLSILRDMQGDFNQLLDRDFVTTPDLFNAQNNQWAPRVDIKEEPHQFVITADLPGVESKDTEVSIENNVLTIKAVRNLERKIKEENYSKVERFSGTFYRQFNLPDHVNGDSIKAKCKNGVLELIVPKKERHVPKKIKVHEDTEN